MGRGRPGAALLLRLLLRLLLLAGALPGAAAPRASTDECGQRPLFDSVSGSRIVGGGRAQVGAWPWSVSLQFHQAGARFAHVCGGALLNEYSVLTAGHCVTGKTDPYSWRAVLGVHNLRKHGAHAAKRYIKSITVHPGFRRETFENDIALFELHPAVRYSDYIQPICLPGRLPPLAHNDTACFISGWGRTAEKGKASAVLKEAQVEIIPSSICNHPDVYSGMVNSNMICAGSWSGGTDTCQGDSGGPLACYHPGAKRYYLLGIASFGIGCGRPHFPGVYVRLSQYRTWIKSELLSSNEAVNPRSVVLPLLLAVVHTVLVQAL